MSQLNVNGRVVMDHWTSIYDGPGPTPNSVQAHGYASRGMNSEQQAIAYANEASEFFANHGLEQTVFVVKGPTSTSKLKFEVCTEAAGYRILHRVKVAARRGAEDGARSALLAALEGLLDNQMRVWKLSGFTEDQIRAMPYLKPSFDAVRMARA